MASVQDILDEATFQSSLAALPPSTLAVIHFHAPWAKPCEQMAAILTALASTYPVVGPVSFFAVDAEELPDISEQYEVTQVPFLVLQKEGKVLETVSGSDAAKVRAAVEGLTGVGSSATSTTLPPAQTVTRPPQGIPTPPNESRSQAPASQASADAKSTSETKSKEELHARLAELVKAAPVMLFMKGTPSAPQCGFSRQTVALLREKSVRYGFFNILADDEVRQGLKEFSDWPTFPQLYVDGELVGGLDIVKEEFEGDPEFLKQYSVSSNSTKAAA